jgi:hypothetical protein
MNKPKLEEGRMRSELEDSAFFREARRAKEASESRPSHSEQPNPEVTPERMDKQTGERSSERNVERRQRRQSFDVFEDQVNALYEIQLKRAKGTAKKPLMGELAREAFDDFIKKERSSG